MFDTSVVQCRVSQLKDTRCSRTGPHASRVKGADDSSAETELKNVLLGIGRLCNMQRWYGYEESEVARPDDPACAERAKLFGSASRPIATEPLC
jgi:hypothetical protein